MGYLGFVGLLKLVQGLTDYLTSFLLIRSPDKSLLDSGDVVIYEGDGRKGLEKYAPFDAIHVGAGNRVSMLKRAVFFYSNELNLYLSVRY